MPIKRVHTEHNDAGYLCSADAPWGVGEDMDFLPQVSSNGEKVDTPRMMTAHSGPMRSKRGEERVNAVDTGEGAEGQVVTSVVPGGQVY